jgi:hypothetical protein
VVLVAAGLAGSGPANAAYDKMLQFRLPAEWSEADVTAVRAITDALESVTDQYDGWRNPWEEGVVGYPLIGGVYCTRTAYSTKGVPVPTNPTTGDPWTWDMAQKVGWSTSDASCRLRDFKWVLAAGGGTEEISILEDQGSVPGGGELLWSPPEHPGQWVSRTSSSTSRSRWRGWLSSPRRLPPPTMRP